MNTTELIATVKARFSHNSAKAQLSEKYTARLTVADQGGLWVANRSLLSFLATAVPKTLVLIDGFGNPVKVDRLSLLAKLTETYTTTMDQWHQEWSELEGKR